MNDKIKKSIDKIEPESGACTVVNDKLQKTQKIKTQARGDQKRWI